MTNRINPLLNTDSYKPSHSFQYPPGTEYVYSYIESRGGDFPQTVFFGLQAFLKEYMSNPITTADVEEAAEFWAAHGEPFDKAGAQYIVDKHGGFWPVAIRAVPEGTVVGVRNVLATIVNTDPKVPWVTSYIETALLRAIWYPTTVASLSYACKRVIWDAIQKSSDDPTQLPFKLHDFGARGASSYETAGLGGMAHLVNFMGSDTVTGILFAKKYYNEPMAGFSIPAAEHSTITTWGPDREVDAYRNMLKQFAKPGALVAVVSDSYNIFNACDNIWGEELRQEVIDSGATVVIRPDSGDPLVMPVDVVDRLGAKFGYTVNSKGYKVLNNVRVIQGDGIDVKSLPVIIDNLLKAGWAIDNLAFGMGGGLLQQVNRDTMRFAMKASYAYVNGKDIDVFKDPISDKGKVSKKGQLALIKENDTFQTVPRFGNAYADLMVAVWRNGDLQRTWTFGQVRENANKIFV